ncbi:uncharacterized protein [Medicago truncatula]|uniref:uncharacterized protein n=1 Tax=Medicago truncatula TaxID=3880 RepID=UPI000D2F3BFC|nr:uncharacterized protein LOC11442131 [Medicago truncatula]
MTLGRTLHSTDDFPPFHSRSTKLPNRKSYFFDITLSNLQMAVRSELVLPPDFNDFLWDDDFDCLFLCNGNPNEGIVIAEIEYQSNESLNTKLKNGWETFCNNNEFQLGDTIRFKFFDGKKSPFVHVYRNNP